MNDIISGADVSFIHQLTQGPLNSDPAPSSTTTRLDDLPLHCKSVGRINLDALSSLASNSADTTARWHHARGWLDDINRYSAVPRRGAASAPRARLSQADIDILQAARVIEDIPPDLVQGHVRVFAVPEFFKNRRRPIKCPRDINATLGKETLMELDMATKQIIINLVNKGSFFVAFDFASYYDQLELSEDVANLQCFKMGNKCYRLRSGAMGQRQMVEVAHSATKKLADVPGLQSTTEAIIDNVIYVGRRDQVRHDGQAFIDRVKAVNGTLNEKTDDIDALVAQRGEWGGIGFDLEKKTTFLTEKITTKLNVSWSRRAEWTYRNMLAHFGLLFWALGIIDVSPGDYPAALQYYTSICRSFAAVIETGREPAYDIKAVVWPTAMKALDQWTAAVMRNTPRHHVTDHKTTWRMCTDACRFGWGYVAVNDQTGEIRFHGQRWGYQFYVRNKGKIHRSTFTEPQAIVNSCCHLLKRTGHRQRVIIGTDNIPTKCNFTKGFSAQSYDQNECRARLRKLFPPEEFDFEFHYVPGSDNIDADALSRTGTIASERVGLIAQDIVRQLGESSRPRAG